MQKVTILQKWYRFSEGLQINHCRKMQTSKQYGRGTNLSVDRQRKYPNILSAGTRMSSLLEFNNLNTTARPFLRSKAGTIAAGRSANKRVVSASTSYRLSSLKQLAFPTTSYNTSFTRIRYLDQLSCRHDKHITSEEKQERKTTTKIYPFTFELRMQYKPRFFVSSSHSLIKTEPNCA